MFFVSHLYFGRVKRPSSWYVYIYITQMNWNQWKKEINEHKWNSKNCLELYILHRSRHRYLPGYACSRVSRAYITRRMHLPQDLLFRRRVSPFGVFRAQRLHSIIVLYTKPSNKRFIIPLQNVILQLASIFWVRVFRNILIPSVRMTSTMSKMFARIICQTVEWEVYYSTAKKVILASIFFSSAGLSSSAIA